MDQIAAPQQPSPQAVNVGEVVSVSVSSEHSFSKAVADEIKLILGEGVEGDAHRGVKVKHRSRVAQNPDQPNLRQVSLLHEEVFEELSAKGFSLKPGDIGENVLTRGIDLLNLPAGTLLHFGEAATIELTGLRNPCAQIENFMPGLLKALLDKDADGTIIRKAGVMAIVVKGGVIGTGDAIRVELPPQPHRKMERV